MVSDGELLGEYIDRNAHEAFATLVSRHLNLVYRTALRRVGGDAHAADDVTQRVFVALARKAVELRHRPSLAGWLHTSSRFAAAEFVRGEQRRRRHEQEAQMFNELNGPAVTSAARIDPMLDEVMATLTDRDREAVLLHFFEGRSFIDVARATASTADAVRMRVNRALDRLRTQLERRGCASTAAALATILSAQSALASNLPDAGGVAQNALAQASAMHATTTLGGQVFAIKSTAVWVGAMAAIATLSVAVYSYRRDADRASLPAAPAATADVRQTPGVSAASPVMGNASGSTSPTSSSASVASTANRPASADFAALSDQEKNLIALLWRFQTGAPAGTRSTIRVGVNAPNFPGIEPLMRRHLITELPESTPTSSRICLTRAGIRFCEKNREAVETFAPTGKFAPPSGGSHDSLPEGRVP